MFFDELNNLQLWGADGGKAHLQALTKEKLYIVAGPEIEELQGYVHVIYKALNGTTSGGACWYDNPFDILQQMDLKPSKTDPDIWMRSSKLGTQYEYIDVYVDDLAICMNAPKAFCDTFKEVYKIKLNVVGPLSYCLVCESEFIAARIATDQISDVRYTLMYLGVPMRAKSYIFHDNESVVDSVSMPASTLGLASYHRVREALAPGYFQFNSKKEDTGELTAKTKGSDRNITITWAYPYP